MVLVKEWQLKIIQAIKMSRVECRSADNTDSHFRSSVLVMPHGDLPWGCVFQAPWRLMLALTEMWGGLFSSFLSGAESMPLEATSRDGRCTEGTTLGNYPVTSPPTPLAL